MNNKQIIIASIVAVLIIILIVFVFPQKKTGEQAAASMPTSPTSFPLDPNTIVPGREDQVSNDTAKPLVVVPSGPGTKTQFRAFQIKFEKGVFSPASIAVNVNDVINVKVNAVDKDCDFIIPDYSNNQYVLKGETKASEFQAVKEGKFAFFCKNAGGISLQSKAVGFLSVVPVKK